MAIVCPSVRPSRPGTDSSPDEIETPGFHRLESLVSNEVIWFHWVKRFPSNEGIKEGSPPLRNRYFTTIARLA